MFGCSWTASRFLVARCCCFQTDVPSLAAAAAAAVASPAGRINTKRASGQKLLFYDLINGGRKVQVMADARCVCFPLSHLHALNHQDLCVCVCDVAFRPAWCLKSPNLMHSCVN